MSYPTLEQYNEALQYPQVSLLDTELKSGSVALTGLGLPLALCGGFALTYTVTTGGKKYAVRCFHKQSNLLEKRYSSISNKLNQLRSQYFLDFEFQTQGIRISGNSYPVVKMAWATGTTLGEFLETNHQNKVSINQLQTSLLNISGFLEKQNIAHGDIQPGNVMVANNGQAIQLIDYDGIFVDDLKSLGSAELGHRNFQHPSRNTNSWDNKLDRFSFISIGLSLKALKAYPELWGKTQSDGDSFLFKANDFAEPSQSTIFSLLYSKSDLADDAKNLAAICKAPFDKIPSLEDYFAKRNIPQISISISTAASVTPSKYISAFAVLDATDYKNCLKYVGDKVELIGRIIEVVKAKTRYGKPYIFVKFGEGSDSITKLNIWSESLAKIQAVPDTNWVGKWISVTGLLDPPYHNKRNKYSNVSITVNQSNQIHLITEKEAKYRLSTGNNVSKSNNSAIIDNIRGNKPAQTASSISSKPVSPNQAILQGMKGTQPSQNAPTSRTKSRSPSSSTPYRPGQGNYSPTPSKKDNSGCLTFIAIVILIIVLRAVFH